jgi:hypothetical protein
MVNLRSWRSLPHPCALAPFQSRVGLGTSSLRGESCQSSFDLTPSVLASAPVRRPLVLKSTLTPSSPSCIKLRMFSTWRPRRPVSACRQLPAETRRRTRARRRTPQELILKHFISEQVEQMTLNSCRNYIILSRALGSLGSTANWGADWQCDRCRSRGG